MGQTITTALEYAASRRERSLEDLKDFVRIPSVSTDPSAVPDMQRAAEWVAAQLRSLGMQQVQVMPTARHPVVFGQWMEAGPDAPTVLMYGHYDVQPPEPLELWQSPAFEPTLRGENLYGRGASDMKGQVVIALKAAEALIKTGNLGVNLKFMVEGEEEIGSPSLASFLQENRDLLACDYAINPDTGMIAADVPTITYGLRGLAYFEIRITGPDHDLHSGLFGGAVQNPANVLCKLIAGMHDDQGRVTLPGFYDAVLPLQDEERAELARLPTGDEFYLRATGAPALAGEAGYTAIERVGARPTLDVNGLLSGFTGQGSKTIIPSHAMAKVSMRLVPEQTPEQVLAGLKAYLQANAPNTVRWEVLVHAGGTASVTDPHYAPVLALGQALQETWGKAPVLKREGGSVPVVADMRKYLGVESVLTGFGLPDDNLHSPNEKIHLPTFYRGIEAFIRFMAKL